MTSSRSNGSSSSSSRPAGRGPARNGGSPLELTQDQLAAIASTLGVSVEEVQALPADQLQKWLGHPDTIAEMEALRADAAAAAAPPGADGEAADLPPEMMAAIAEAIGVTVEELRGATHDELLAWLADPAHFFATRDARAAAAAAPPAVGGPASVGDEEPAAAPAYDAAPDAGAEAGSPPAAASSLQRFRDLRRQTLQSRLGNRPEVMNWLLGRIEELERSEDAARAAVRPAPPRAQPSRPAPRDSTTTPDLMLLKGVRAIKSAPPPPPSPSLLGRLASGLGGLFKRTPGRNNRNTKPPRR